MASNSFGSHFRFTTFGESHGKVIGVVIDGCPSGLSLSEEDIGHELLLRAPGQNSFTSPRKEKDHVEIVSGLFEGVTTGAPITMLIRNRDADSSKYTAMKDILRPGHANYTYLAKYGVFDYRGGGRASARETAARVAAGAVAKKLLTALKVKVAAFLQQVAEIQADVDLFDKELSNKVRASALFCPDSIATEKMCRAIEQALAEGDSVGGTVQFVAHGIPPGWGDPVYQKIEAQLAHAMLSIPASKGFEIGSGFASTRLRGSEHNDEFISRNGSIQTLTNQAGGVLAGISTGMPIWGQVAFKPTSSIQIPQNTVDLQGNPIIFQLPEGSRHDPCVAIRAVPVVEAMAAVVFVNAWLQNETSQLHSQDRCSFHEIPNLL